MLEFYKNHIPLEIVLTFGKYLDGHTLLASLQVCREWNHTLYPYIWRIITKFQWNHPRFPIQQPSKRPGKIIRYYEFSRESDVLLAPNLSRVLSLEWYCNGYYSKHAGISRYYRLKPQLPFDRLEDLLRMMPNLVVLSLRIDTRGLTSLLFYTIANLHHLKKLSIDIPYSMKDGESFMPMIPVFERLEELELDGTWNPRIKVFNPLFFPRETPWNIRKLGLNSINNLWLLRYCPNLQDIRFGRYIPTPQENDFSMFWEKLCIFFPQMVDLTTIEFEGISPPIKIQRPLNGWNELGWR